MTEASEFIDIYEGLGQFSDTEMLARLRTFVGGASMLVDETSKGNRARNVGFELLVAATVVKCNLPINLTPPADITISMEPRPVFVECKRPFVAAKIENRIRKGLRQLVERYNASKDPSNAQGILAMSISKTENDGSRALAGRNEFVVRAKIDQIFNAFIARHKRHWEQGVDPRTLAVLLELRAPCLLENPSMLAIARHHVFAIIGKPDPQARNTLDLLMSAFARLKT